MISVLGVGAFGKVLLVRKHVDRKLYAMKVVKKKKLVHKDPIKCALIEKQILACLNSPFLVRLNYAFQNEQKLFLVMEYCPGGELFFYLD